MSETEFNLSEFNLTEFNLTDNQTIEIMIDKFVSYFFSQDAVLNLEDTLENAKFISGIVKQFGKDTYVIGNFLCAGGGVMIGTTSVLNFYRTNNIIARACYGVSAFCGGSATIAGTLSACNGVCGLSYVAIGGDIMGGSFLWVGNRAKNFGDFLDGKKSVNPFGPKRFKGFARRPSRPISNGYKGVSFVSNNGNLGDLTEVLSNIPYTEILVLGGTVFTIYRSTKLLIKCYRSLYRYLEKKYFPKLNYSHAEYLINEYYMERMQRLYKLKYKTKTVRRSSLF